MDCDIPPLKNLNPESKNKKPKVKVDNPNNLRVLHFNRQGLANEDRLYEIERGLENKKWDIPGLSETRKEGEKLIKRKNGNILYNYNTSKGYRGVRFYIRSEITKTDN